MGILLSSTGQACATGFAVDSEVCVLVSGTFEGDLPLMRRVHGIKDEDDKFVYKPVVQDGVPIVLSQTNCPLVVTVPGYYEFDLEGIEGDIVFEELECKQGLNFNSPSGPVKLDTTSIDALCACINTSLEMTLNVELTPENKNLLAECIAQALGETTLKVTLDNVDAVVAALCADLEPKLQAIVDAISTSNTSLLTALTAQTAAITSSIVTVCNKIEESNVLLAAIDAKLASNQVSLLECLEDIKTLLEVKTPALPTRFCKPKDFGQNTSGSFFEDAVGSPITRVIELDIPEDGVFLGARIRLNALATFGGTQTSVSFILTNEDTGDTYTTNAVNTFGGVFPHDFLLETPLEVTRGQFFSLRAVVEDGGIADEVQFNGTSTRQIAYFTGAGNDGNPMITFLVQGQDTITKVTFTDKTEQFFDSEGVCIDELPRDFEACVTDIQPTSNTHMIEGCILSDPDDPNSKIPGYTIIGDNGEALFPPRPLTDLGFEEC